MRWERPLLRVGEYLVGRSCRRLPGPIRDERYREWTAELPAILNDPGTKPAVRRAVRMLCYAAGTIRAAALASGRARLRPAVRRTLMIGLRITPTLAAAAYIAWATMTASGNRISFLLTVLAIFGAGKLALIGVRRLWAHRAGRK
jgi:hypothetical protein